MIIYWDIKTALFVKCIDVVVCVLHYMPRAAYSTCDHTSNCNIIKSFRFDSIQTVFHIVGYFNKVSFGSAFFQVLILFRVQTPNVQNSLQVAIDKSLLLAFQVKEGSTSENLFSDSSICLSTLNMVYFLLFGKQLAIILTRYRNSRHFIRSLTEKNEILIIFI